jgi:hypothetical protein
MPLDTFEKQPYEEFFITVDFSQVLGATETIASATCIVTDLATGADESAIMCDSPDIVGQTVLVMVKAGTTSSSYNVSVRIVTSLSQKFEADLNMNVLEDT